MDHLPKQSQRMRPRARRAAMTRTPTRLRWVSRGVAVLVLVAPVTEDEVSLLDTRWVERQ